MSKRLSQSAAPDPALKQKVQGLLRDYFELLQNGTAGLHMADPTYRWRHYDEHDRSLEALRLRLADIGAYLNANPQHDWVNRQAHTTFEAGPDLNRLPDGAMLAMFQQLDALYAEHLGEAEPSAGASPATFLYDEEE